ncbi:hypothetical protein NT01EI_2553 [Edwardsiella ictaluri 93-146]|uniref:Uncharacterized protein n=1 Tax=Edwardsiella ictaluri (strain 93-146) TaxID=634503 RepID=C5BFZ4_EDWI9|nr:hypothetical protein NT01EI_2553 [Edwardsiella ictaluri 93-146]
MDGTLNTKGMMTSHAQQSHLKKKLIKKVISWHFLSIMNVMQGIVESRLKIQKAYIYI